MKNITRLLLFITITITLCSCNESEYTDAIPSNSTALIAVNAADFAGKDSPFASLLTPFVDNEAKQLKGIDLTKDIYLFSAADGNIGLCAPIKDYSSFDDFTSRLETIGVLENKKEQNDNIFYTFKKQWIMGYNDNSLLVMGPITGYDAETRLIRRMSKLLSNDNKNIEGTILWQHLNKMKGNIRMVAEAAALPEQLSVIVMLGCPKGTDATDVLLEANMEYKNGTLVLKGNTSSYNQNVEQSLQRLKTSYKPITVDWRKYMNDSILIGVFMNVKGEELTPYIQQNKSLSSALMGTEAFNKIKENDGNMAITFTQERKSDKADNYKVKVTTPTAENINGTDKMIVAVNIKALTAPIAEGIKPFIGNINTIIYNLKVE